MHRQAELQPISFKSEAPRIPYLFTDSLIPIIITNLILSQG